MSADQQDRPRPGGPAGAPVGVDLHLPAAALEQIARRAAQLVLEQLAAQTGVESPYLTVAEAATFARCKRQRIDDLLSSRRLRRYKDGRRTLVSRAELEARLNGSNGRP